MKNILLVEDDILLRLALLTNLEMRFPGHKVLAASNGREAIDIIDTLPVDFILTDLNMDVMDGYALLAYLRENRPGIPAAVMTGATRAEVKDRLAALGVSKWFEKPFDLNELETEIEDAVCRGEVNSGMELGLTAA